MESIITSVQSCRALGGGGSQPGGRGLTGCMDDLENLVQIMRSVLCSPSEPGFGDSAVEQKRKHRSSC